MERFWTCNDLENFAERDLLTIRVGPRGDDPQVRKRAVHREIDRKVQREPVL